MRQNNIFEAYYLEVVPICRELCIIERPKLCQIWIFRTENSVIQSHWILVEQQPVIRGRRLWRQRRYNHKFLCTETSTNSHMHWFGILFPKLKKSKILLIPFGELSGLRLRVPWLCPRNAACWESAHTNSTPARSSRSKGRHIIETRCLGSFGARESQLTKLVCRQICKRSPRNLRMIGADFTNRLTVYKRAKMQSYHAGLWFLADEGIPEHLGKLAGPEG